MTDPTPEQIEAAAAAYDDHGKHTRYYDNRVCTECDEYFEGRAPFEAHRWAAALVAAAGVTPQDPERIMLRRPDGTPKTNAEIRAESAAIRAAAGVTPQEPRGCSCSAYSEDRGGGHFELMLEPEPGCPEHGAGIAAPVQVDEAKLAEIARRVDLHEWSRLGGSQGEQVADIVRAVLRGGGQ